MQNLLIEKFELTQDVVARTNQDGTVIIMKMDESNTFYKINGIAADYWRSLTNKVATQDFINNAIKEYNVTKETIESDISNLLATLLNKNLIS
jgi:ornithine carbamoyltransferase